MKGLATAVCLALPPLLGLLLFAIGSLTSTAQLLQVLLFAWPAASVGLWLTFSLLFGLRPQARAAAVPWSVPSKLMHWFTALTVLATTALMYYMTHLGDTKHDPVARAEYARLLKLHKSLGLIALFLIVFRVAWNAWRSRPPLPAGMPHTQVRLAKGAHGVLYAGLLLVPLVGWMSSMTYGGKTSFFYLFELPVWLPTNKAWAAVLQPLHIWLAWGLLTLVGFHLGAALWHHFVRQDATLVQMLPRTPHSP